MPINFNMPLRGKKVTLGELTEGQAGYHSGSGWYYYYLGGLKFILFQPKLGAINIQYAGEINLSAEVEVVNISIDINISH